MKQNTVLLFRLLIKKFDSSRRDAWWTKFYFNEFLILTGILDAQFRI